MRKDEIKTKNPLIYKQEWQEFENHIAWWESEQPLAPLPQALQTLLDNDDPAFVEQLLKFAILTESNYIWNKEKNRYDYTNQRQIETRDRSWIWTLYLQDKPLAREGLKELLAFHTYQKFNQLCSDLGVYYYYYSYSNRNHAYHITNRYYTRYLKAIYKLAEKKQDTEVWSSIAYRFEVERSYYHHFKNPNNKSDYGVGATPKTRSYLVKRCWRTLRNLGEQNSPHYINMAYDLLLLYKNNDARRTTITNTNNQQQSIQSFKENWILNHILYHQSNRFTYGSSAWQEKPDAYTNDCPNDREEAFPHLWDQHPEKLFQLLVKADASPVVHFAGRALRLGNQTFVSQLPDTAIQELLQSSEPYRQDFAVRELLNRLDKYNPNLNRWLMLSTHNNPRIRKLANDFLRDNYAGWSKDTQNELILLCMDKLSESQTAAYLEEWYSLFKEELHPVLTEIVHLSMLTPLLTQKNAMVHRFVALLLPAIQIHLHPFVAEDLLAFLESESAEIREVARNILHQKYMSLPCTPDFLAKWCAVPYEDNQVFLTPFFAERMHWLMPTLPEFLNSLWAQMMLPDIPEMSRIYIQNNLLGTMFLSGLMDTPMDQILALLDHHDTDFQTLGSRIFAAKKPTVEQFTPEQLVQLAHNQIVLCRNEARNLLIQKMHTLSDEQLVQLVETDWDDTRYWGFGYMWSLSIDQFTPTLIYGLIDSSREDVQAFGMELIEIHFDDIDIRPLLLRASESTDLFVQEYALSLAEKITWDVEKVQKLELFFRTILFKVHQARKAKQMTFQLLHRISKQDQQMAEAIIPLFQDVAHIGGKHDFERILSILTELQTRYPELQTPITIQ